MFEAGDIAPGPDTVASFARLLGFPREFFYASPIAEVHHSAAGASFRSLKRMTAGQREAALGAGELAFQLADWIEHVGRFTLPTPEVPDLREVTPQEAALAIRAHWGLGETPVRSMVHLLESKGIRVFSLAEDCAEVDAFSIWRKGIPYVFLNTKKSSERSRFDAAHELGHLVLHRHGIPQGRDPEREANAFASAFLMPAASVVAVAPRLPSVDALIKLKRGWGVSVGAMARRLSDLEIVTQWHYRSLCIEIAERGYRTNEPESIPHESSKVLSQVFEQLAEDGIRKADVAKALNLPISELEALVFGVSWSKVSGGRSGDAPAAPPSKGHLRLLE